LQRPDDVAEARKLIGGKAGVLVKLEKPAAIGRLDEIVELTDASWWPAAISAWRCAEDVPPIQRRNASGEPATPASRDRRDADDGSMIAAVRPRGPPTSPPRSTKAPTR